MPKPVKLEKSAKELLRFDLDNENETTSRNYRQRVKQCESLSEFAMAEQIRKIQHEQEHQIDLGDLALGEDPPDLG